MAEVTTPSRRPFIESDLRPDLDSPQRHSAPSLGASATTEEITSAAQRVLAEAGYAGGRTGEGPKQFMTRILRPSPDVQFTVLDEEAVLLNLNNGHYYTLNRVGTAMWELFIGTRSLAQVLDEVCERFEVDRERAHDDLVALMFRMEHEGLLHTERG